MIAPTNQSKTIAHICVSLYSDQTIGTAHMLFTTTPKTQIDQVSPASQTQERQTNERK